jgi:Fasciclin domain
MLEGSEVTVAGSGTNFTVNGESVVCGNVQTSNVTVYIVDTVLMPQSWAPGPAPFPGRNRARSRAFPPRRPLAVAELVTARWAAPSGCRCDVAHCGPWHATLPRPHSRLNQS